MIGEGSGHVVTGSLPDEVEDLAGLLSDLGRRAARGVSRVTRAGEALAHDSCVIGSDGVTIAAPESSAYVVTSAGRRSANAAT